MLNKQLVHAFHQSLKSLLPDIKLGQSREILASYYGFKSAASLIKAGFVIPSYDCWYIEPNEDDEFSPRSKPQPSLPHENYVRSRLQQLSNTLLSDPQLEEKVLLHISQDNSIKQCEFYHWNEIAPWMVDYLGDQLIERLISEDNASAAYSYATHHFSEIEIDDDSEPHEDYWYKKYISGEILEGGALRFAKEYEEKLSLKSQYLSLIKRAADLGSKEAMMVYAEHTDDVGAIRKLAKQGYYPAIESTYDVYGDSQHEELLAYNGHEGAILHLMEKYERTSKEDEQYRLVFLNELANLYGYYPSQSIADNDEDYGPAFVIYEGISLPKINDELKEKAKTEARIVFNQHKH
ncbi:hypothetical protein [Vibrio kanaloae]|uniref:hypothetical protein n=1 Tax=Vibrio kanaloae TaxID=170673 RepID=UPI0009899AE6|nr:hypothetical protein [Vibrio kanaloae]QPK03399.1 hypothetical protein BTD91_08850 [Vibrio kanaloae]